MTENIVYLSAVVAIAFSVIGVLSGPFIIGRNRKFTATSYCWALLESALMVILAGHALAWW